MAINTNLSFPFLLLSFFFFFFFFSSLTFSPVVANRDLELCFRRCWVRHKSSPQKVDECLQICEDAYGHIVLNSEVEPEKQLRECQEQCDRRQQGEQKEQCRRQCQETYERRRGEEEGEGGGEEKKDNQQEEEEQQEQNPYVFQDEHFITSQSNEGRVKILQKFHQRSRLLRGLENYRFLSIEANPQTFVLPAHLDAEAVLYVASGRGTISLVRKGKRESFNINHGDVVRISAGTTLYIINRDKNKKLRIAKLLQPVSLPDEFQAYYGSTGEKPPSFYRAFSPELLSTALKADQDKVQRAISQQNKGVIVKASEQQIQALSQREESRNPQFKRSKRVFNLLSKEPSISNRYGRLHEVDANEFPQLQDMDVAVAYANITKGAMQGPFFNSRSTKIALVINGEGYMEMACPHVAQQQQQQQQQGQQGTIQHYQRISSSLNPGMIFVVPTGHPIIIVSGNNRNLEIACFDVNAENNWREALAGDKNTVNAMEKEAKELAFGIPAREVDEVFGKQNERFFFPGPRGGRPPA